MAVSLASLIWIWWLVTFMWQVYWISRWFVGKFVTSRLEKWCWVMICLRQKNKSSVVRWIWCSLMRKKALRTFIYWIHDWQLWSKRPLVNCFSMSIELRWGNWTTSNLLSAMKSRISCRWIMRPRLVWIWLRMPVQARSKAVFSGFWMKPKRLWACASCVLGFIVPWLIRSESSSVKRWCRSFSTISLSVVIWQTVSRVFMTLSAWLVGFLLARPIQRISCSWRPPYLVCHGFVRF